MPMYYKVHPLAMLHPSTERTLQKLPTVHSPNTFQEAPESLQYRPLFAFPIHREIWHYSPSNSFVRKVTNNQEDLLSKPESKQQKPHQLVPSFSRYRPWLSRLWYHALRPPDNGQSTPKHVSSHSANKTWKPKPNMTDAGM